jgi:hypothetical protein
MGGLSAGIAGGRAQVDQAISGLFAMNATYIVAGFTEDRDGSRRWRQAGLKACGSPAEQSRTLQKRSGEQPAPPPLMKRPSAPPDARPKQLKPPHDAPTTIFRSSHPPFSTKRGTTPPFMQAWTPSSTSSSPPTPPTTPTAPAAPAAWARPAWL